MKDAAAKGFEFGNHSYSHKVLKDKSKEEIKSDINQCKTLLKDRVGLDVNLVRLPQLQYDEGGVVLSTLKELNMPSISDNYDSCDWKDGTTSETIIEAFKNNPPEDGSIILCHMGVKSMGAIPTVLKELSNKGYEFVTVSELFEKSGKEMPLGEMITSVK